MTKKIDVILLFSGGLDSILAVKILAEQRLNVKCAHFTSPFFGEAQKIPEWQNLYDLDIQSYDASPEFTQMLLEGPEHGFGKALNPCIDCKITLLKLAKKIMQESGASFIATGEVLGQRPMSQRFDTLHLIQNKANVGGMLLRPLSALHFTPTLAETSGLVNRESLLAISGRGRNEQFALAAKFGLSQFPTPAGGCRLTEKENARRYWPVFKKWKNNVIDISRAIKEFRIANHGRQFYLPEGNWLCIGRNKEDNKELQDLQGERDLILRLKSLPGPVALAVSGKEWPDELIKETAAFILNYAPKAKMGQTEILVESLDTHYTLCVEACKNEQWFLPSWNEVYDEIKKNCL